MKNTGNIRRTGENGIALLTVLFAILLLSAIAVGMMYMSTAETQINANFKDSAQAYFAARSGIEEVRERLRKASGNTFTALAGFPGTSPTAAGGVLYLLNPSNATVKPWDPTNQYFDTELAHENFYNTVVNPGSGVPCTVPNAAGTPASICVPNAAGYYVSTNALASSNTLDFKWVRVNVKTNASQNDMTNATTPGTLYNRIVDQTRNGAAADFSAPVCFDESSTTTMSANAPIAYGKPLVLPNGEADCLSHVVAGSPNQWQRVYTITSLAVTPTGARRILQAEVARQVVPPLSAALTIDGPNPTYGGLNSANSGIKGTNQATAAQIATGDCGTGVSEASIGVFDASSVNNVTLSRPANYSGNPSGVNNIGPTGLNLLGPLSTVGGLRALVSNLTNMADSVCDTSTGTCSKGGGTTPKLGTTVAPLITVVNGPYGLGSSGSGILVVTGNFDMGGNLNWDGLIIVVGTGVYQQRGTSDVYGGVLVANIVGLPDNASPGSPNINFNGGGGNGGIYYDSCKVNFTNNLAPYQIISMKELQY